MVVTPQRVVERKDGRSGSRRALRARAGSRRGRRGPPILQEPVLGAADSERRNRSRVLGVLYEVSAAISHQALQLPRNLCGDAPRKSDVIFQKAAPASIDNDLVVIIVRSR